MSDNTHTKPIDIIETIKLELYELLNSIPDDEKTTLKDLVDKIVYKTKIQVSMVNSIVPMLVHTWCREGNGTISRGRDGGIRRGVKKQRVDPRPRCSECHQVLRKINSEEK